jgi:hypothetical protein
LVLAAAGGGLRLRGAVLVLLMVLNSRQNSSTPRKREECSLLFLDCPVWAGHLVLSKLAGFVQLLAA